MKAISKLWASLTVNNLVVNLLIIYIYLAENISEDVNKLERKCLAPKGVGNQNYHPKTTNASDEYFNGQNLADREKCFQFIANHSSVTGPSDTEIESFIGCKLNKIF